MNSKHILATTLFAGLLVSSTAFGQGTVRGAAEGAHEGGRAAGPVGAVVGGAVGAAVGTVRGILGVEDQHRFHEYAVRERRDRHAYKYKGNVKVGIVLPAKGVTYYPVPEEYHVPAGYVYTYVNDEPVIVQKRTRKVVEIIN